jgi:hypothetical protein
MRNIARNHPQRLMLPVFTFLVFGIGAFATSVPAQNAQVFEIQVPFDFVVKGRTYPAANRAVTSGDSDGHKSGRRIYVMFSLFRPRSDPWISQNLCVASWRLSVTSEESDFRRLMSVDRHKVNTYYAGWAKAHCAFFFSRDLAFSTYNPRSSGDCSSFIETRSVADKGTRLK